MTGTLLALAVCGLARADTLDDARLEAARVVRTQAETYATAKDPAGALERWQAAATLDPADPWATIGIANAQIDLGVLEDARAVLASLPSDAPADAVRERDRALARSWRREAEDADRAGNVDAALAAWRNALAGPPDLWTLVGIGAFYAGHHQPADALLFFDEALAVDPREPVALRGRAYALEATGRPVEALAVLDALLVRDDGEETRKARQEMAPRVVVARASDALRAGHVDEARDIVDDAIEAQTMSPDAWSVAASVYLADHRISEALTAARRAVDGAPESAWARHMLRVAGAACRCSAGVLDDLGIAYDRTRSAAAAEDVDAARFEAALESGARPNPAGRFGLVAASGLARTPDAWTRLAEEWLLKREPDDALAAAEHALALDPAHAGARAARGRALAAALHLRRAEAQLAHDFAERPDPRVGAALVDVQLARGRAAAAKATLAKVDALPPPAPPPPPEGPPPIPLLPAPSGAKPLDVVPALPPPEPPRADLADARKAVRRARSPRVTVAGLFAQHGGPAGSAQVLAVATPVTVSTPPLGPVRIFVEAAPVWLFDDAGEDRGVAVSAGLATTPGTRLSLAAWGGTSPIGFLGGWYPTWAGSLTGRLTPRLSLGLDTSRAPRADTRTSWAGTVYGDGGPTIGRVSEITADAWLGWNPGQSDLGLKVRGGRVEGLGVEPNPLVEGLLWAGGTTGDNRASLRLGGLALAQSYARTEDRIEPGHGGYFSPPLFLLGLVSLDGAFGGEAFRVCGSLQAGPHYVSGADTAFSSSGLAAVGSGRLGARVRLSTRWEAGVDATAQVVSDGWHSEGVVARLAWGAARYLPSAASWTPIATNALAPSIDTGTCSIR